MISGRFASGVIALALLALVPTVIHNYLGLLSDDGRRVANLDVTVPGMTREGTPRKAAWFRQSFETDDALEYEFSGSGQAPIKLTVIRSYNAKLLFHHPENVVAYGQALHEHDIVTVTGLPGVPVHRLRPEGDLRDHRRALYVLSYRGAFVESAVRFQVGVVWRLLFQGRSPMTLVFAQTTGEAPPTAGFEAEGRVLTAALRALELVPPTVTDRASVGPAGVRQ